MHMVVFITVGGEAEARKISETLVELRLAACVNIIGPVHSVYRWKEEVEKAEECLLMVKTSLERLDALIKKVKEIHSYNVPEIIALNIDGGSEDYLRWLDSCVKGGCSQNGKKGSPH